VPAGKEQRITPLKDTPQRDRNDHNRFRHLRW
jgi:hypothetical protein